MPLSRGSAELFPSLILKRLSNSKAQLPDVLLVGERKGRKIAGFDLGNSPTAILRAELRGKTMVHTTSNGTQGIANAKQATQIMTGSFVNAKAIADYIRSNAISDVSLVCMGTKSREAIEDTLCAEYIRDLVAGHPTRRRQDQRNPTPLPKCQPLLRSRQRGSPQSDFELCLDVNRYPFVLLVQPYREGLVSITR